MNASGTEGFSLVELLIALAVAPLAVSLAAPSWNDLAQKRQLTASGELMASFLSRASSLAVRHNGKETVGLRHGCTRLPAAANCSPATAAAPAAGPGEYLNNLENHQPSTRARGEHEEKIVAMNL